MPTVRSPSSFAARNMRMAISLRLAASSFCMFFGFVITGAKSRVARNFTFLHERAAMPQEFFQCGGQRKFIENGRLRSEGSRQSLRAHWLRRCGFQLPQLRFDFAPFFGLAFSGIRSVGGGEKVQQLRAKIGCHVGKLLLGKLAEQRGMRIIIHAVFARRSEFAPI